MGRARQRRRLVWRVYLHGLLLIVVVAVAVSAVALLSDPDPRWHWRPSRALAAVAAALSPSAQDPARLKAHLDQVAEATGRSLAVYRRDGTLLARAGADPAGPIAEEELRHLEASNGHAHPRLRSRAAWLDAERRTYLVVATEEDGGGLRFAALVGTILLVAALASVPLARAITRPLERLTATSRVLADGELSARSGIRRRDEVGELARALDEMADRLEARIRAEKEMLANVSHELRTPLARIRVALELCAERDVELEAVKEHLRGIAEDAEELEQLVADILTAARLDLRRHRAGGTGLPLTHAPLAVADWVERAAEGFSERFPGTPLTVRVAEGLPSVRGDLALLRRLLDNLLGNAAKHSRAGEAVALEVHEEQGRCCVEVLDQGVGVTPEDIPRLFEPFFRTERSREKGVAGLGLGLTLCRRIAEAHGGTIVAEANQPRGLRVRVRLPFG